MQTLILTGAYTNVVVEHTARHAADLGFTVLVARDGASTINDEWHRASVDFALPLVATVTTCDEIIGALRLASDARSGERPRSASSDAPARETRGAVRDVADLHGAAPLC